MSVGRRRKPDSASRATRLAGWFLDRPFYVALAVGVPTYAFFWGLLWLDYSMAQGWPREQARLISVKETPSFLGCGRGSDGPREIQWESPSAPAGLPQRFLETDTCFAPSVGEVWPVVRVVEDGETVVIVNPAGTKRQISTEALVPGGAAFGAMLAVLYLNLGWRGLRAALKGWPSGYN